MAADTNLPTSTGSGDLDNIAVTRAEFRNEIGILLEYLAQALGDVGGSYTNEPVKPTEVKLQGTPTIEVEANPVTDSADQRIPSTKWVKESGTYVNGSAYGAPVDGQLWVDTSDTNYALKAYNSSLSTPAWQLVGGFPSGTKMLFQQETAPTGWTKVEKDIDNHALRVTTSSPGIVSGNQSFSTVFSQKTSGGKVSDHTMTLEEMPAHSHGVRDTGHGHDTSTHQISGGFNPGTHSQINPTGVFRDSGRVGTVEGHDAYNGRRVDIEDTHEHSVTTGHAQMQCDINGNGEAHSHGFVGTNIDLRINYVDVIVATKD